MGAMRARILLRKIHHWASVFIAVPLIITIGTGILLMLKKDVDWIQPPSQKGVERTVIPVARFETLFEAAKSVPQAGIDHWTDLSRVDVKPGSGMVKFVSATNWEVQVDTHTADVLQVAYRRSDIIEAIHDGSFFTSWTKHYVFLPSAVILFVMWATGLYLFALPHLKRREKRKTRDARTRS